MKTLLTTALILVIVAGPGVYIFSFYPLRNAHPALLLPHGSLVIRGAKVYPSPDAAPLDKATILTGQVIYSKP